jgi:hypothetical protein
MLQAFDGLADPVLARLREPASQDAETIPPVPQALLDVARRAAEGRRKSAPDAGATVDWLPAGQGRRLGKFELQQELGIGSFGSVYRARDTELDRTVAIKVPRAGSLASHQDVDRFLREARSAAQLKHPGIVSLYETGLTEDGTCYLVEEYILGATLADHLTAGRIGFHRAAELVAAVAEALHYAHEQGVIHRDIKPSNIMLDLEGRPHLMDFGLAKRDTGECTMTQEGQVLGTPAYMSPEQARGESHHVDARTDIYSLGVILYELLTGERPFRGNRRMLLLQLLEDEPRPPRRLNDKIPRDLETICLKAMAKAPARRYATAQEMAEDLRRYLNGEPIRARPIGGVERLGRWCRRNPVAASLVLAVSLGPVCGLWHLSNLAGHFVRSTALTSAAQQAEMLERVNTHYTRVVNRLTAHGIEATHHYQDKPGSMPVPATLLTELGNDISESESGMRFRHYSAYPFRSRSDGGPHDDLEWEALQHFADKPGEPFYRFVDIDGRPYLRYMRARLMQASCIDCHNHHPDSTKRDWKEGDVRGVLEIIRPLDQDIARTRAGLRGTFILVAVISGSLLLLSVLVLVGNRRRSYTPSARDA